MSAIPRNEGEDFADYKVRREADHQEIYNKLYYGVMFHDSAALGTYVRATTKVPSKKALKKQQLKGGK